ncbi:acyl carrier protein [Cohnella cholangitidis]|uniref:Acyl carrier protein n=1 Tax=Cohnella cholangitidis TaxID=2598458 RepID=A0A7G5C421_9BACL|nr:acyl carrier protein [Cohnella cholangitidis]QMV43955.1 acyl carrier protein [Cohnella cholangitidis]
MLTLSDQEIELKVKEIIAAISSRDAASLQMGDVLADGLGVDSVRFLELLAVIEEEFRFDLGVDDIRPELFRTVRSVVYFVKERINRE